MNSSYYAVGFTEEFSEISDVRSARFTNTHFMIQKV